MAELLVTGARGFVGTAICRIFDDLGMAWRAFAGDVCRYEDFREYPDARAIVHLAGRTRFTDENRFQAFTTNVLGALNAARFACEQGGSLFFASTCCYAPDAPMPVPETAPLHPSSAYARSKISAEDIIQHFAHEFGLPGCIFRLFNVYGPGQPQGFVVPDYLSRLPSERLTIFNPDAMRDFIHVDDAARFMATAVAATPTTMHCVNAGTGVGHSVQQVVAMLCALMDTRPEFEYALSEVAIMESVADITLARRLFGWEPSIELEQGLRRVVEAAQGTGG